MELVLIAVSLSMDAFAVAMCKGLGMKRVRIGQAALIALFFGVFQAVMPLIGWLLGKQFESYIVEIDHWIAFALLAYIGGRMIWGACHAGEAETQTEQTDEKTDIKELLLMAIATSIDALAVGISFAFLQMPILPAVTLIGSITFSLSLVGVWVGHRCGAEYKGKAEIAGGVVLVLIGLKILLEHLGILG